MILELNTETRSVTINGDIKFTEFVELIKELHLEDWLITNQPEC